MKVDATGKSFTDKIAVKAGKKGNKTTIQGFANAFVVDRGKEIIETDAWELEDFKKNPVILVEHGFHPMFAGLPVGKAINIQETDGGLAFEAEISSSKTEPITMIRDLVDEGFLKAVSVGFDPIDDEEVDGVKRISKAALFEISLVGIPMNQDSLVDVKSHHHPNQKKQYLQRNLSTIRMEICKLKGAVFAAEVHRRILFLQKETGVERESVLDDFVRLSGNTMDEVMEVLKGDADPSKDLIKAIADILVMDPESLTDISKAEIKKREEEERVRAEEEEAKRHKDFQDCVQAKIPGLLSEGMEQEQAVAVAISRCQEGEKTRIRLTNEEYSELIEFTKLEAQKIFKQALQDTVDGNTTAIDNTIDSVKTDNPLLDLLKQNNVLLGSLINEVQGMRAQMPTEVKEPDPEPVETEEEKAARELAEKDAEEKARLEEEKRELEGEKGFADNVNKKFSITKDNVELSYKYFAKSNGYKIYQKDDSRSEVYNKIVKAYFLHGFTNFEPHADLDKFLSEENKSRIEQNVLDMEKAERQRRLDNVKERLENYTERLKSYGE
jgi:HK97 family phage prohead protease